MRTNYLKATLNFAVLAASILLFGAVAAFGQTATVSGGPLVFGYVATGTTSAPQTLTVTADSTTTLGVFTSANLAFSNAAFSAPSGSCLTGSTAPGGSCTINVVFSSTVDVAITGAALTISPTTSSMTAVIVSGSPVSLSGTAYGANATVALNTGSSLGFGTVAVGSTSSTSATLTVTADSNTTLDKFTSPTSLVFSNAAFSASSASTCITTGVTTLGGNCTIIVVFSPTAAGPITGTLTINATNGGQPVTTSGSPVSGLSGTGYLPALSTQLMGKVVTLTNQLSTPLTFTPTLSSSVFSIVTTGAGAGTCPFVGATITLAAGFCTINITAGTPSTTETAQLNASYSATNASGTTANIPLTPVTIGETAPPGSTAGSATDTGLEQVVLLTAAPTAATMPDGTTVPMWGYFCGAAVTTSGATCAKLNPNAIFGWSPVVITVPSGQDLEIELTNNLSFTPTGSSTPNNIPTSLVIVGQVGGGLGSVAQRTTTPSPNHSEAQGCVTWFIADPNTPPGVPCATNTLGALPPTQGPRVQSFATEVAAGATTDLTWKNLRPGTYLLESGTHPSIQVPMGLIGVVVVTTAPSGTTAGTAYPAARGNAAVSYNAEVPLEFSEIDAVQNKQVDLAVRTVGFNETAVWTRMNAFGPVTALTLTSGGTGYTAPPSVMFTSTSGTGAAATATLSFAVAGLPTIATSSGGYASGQVLTLSGGAGTPATVTVGTVDGSGAILTLSAFTGGSYTTAPTNPINVTGGTGTGATLTATFTGFVSGITLTNAGDGYTTAPTVQITGGTTNAVVTASITVGGCGGGAHTCYPPAVNYTPFYYLINGLAFNKTSAAASLFAATAGVTGTPPVAVTTGITGSVLVRLVNAGLHMHVPSIVGSQTQGFSGAGAAATVGGFTLIAEDGNPVPNLAAPRVQTDVFMAAGKVFDVMVNVPATPTGATAPPALPVYDRSLSLSGNSSVRDAGMLAYIGINGSTLPVAAGTGVFAAAKANDDTYKTLVAGQAFTVTDPSKGVMANDVNVYGVTLLTLPTNGTVTCSALPQSAPVQGICANGTFTYTPNAGSTATSDSFTYCANNGFVAATASCSSANLTATVHLGAATLEAAGGITCSIPPYSSNESTYLKIASPGVLQFCRDAAGYPLNVAASPAPTLTGGTLVSMDRNGGFIATVGTHTGAAVVPLIFSPQNSQGTVGASQTVMLNFPAPSNLQVTVVDAQLYNNCNLDPTCITGLAANSITDYRWIIEEDKTFWTDPNCTTNSSISTPGCPSVVGPAGQSTIPTYGVQFHTSTMDYVAQGCTGPLSCEGGQTMLDTRPACTGGAGVPAGCSSTPGQHIPAVCDVGNGACRPDPTGNGYTAVLPSSVHLDPTKRYYISVLPGDAANPFPPTATPSGPYFGPPVCTPGASTSTCGHTMSGAPVPPACNILTAGCTPTSTAAFAPVTVLSLPTPLPTGKLSVIVFEDDFPLNGEQDGGGGVDVISPNEPGLGGFNIVLWDTYGGLGDVTGQDTYDAFNQPLSNALAGTKDPASGLDACPLSAQDTQNPTQAGITGMIVTCPKFESDGKTLSPLAGQAVIANLMPDKFSVQAYPGADRVARGEEWLQTNTLDGQHPHDSFIRIGEPGYFQEYGPAGYHVSIGFANPAIINARHDAVCAGAYSAVGPCTNTIYGQVNVQRQSRTPDQRLYTSGSRDALAWTQCWVSLGDPDAEDFMFTKCDANGNFKFTSVPGGQWRITLGDQWNDQIIDGLSTPANVGCTSSVANGVINSTTCPGGQTLNMGNIGVQQWQANIYTRTFIDDNKNGIPDPGEIGIPLLYTRVYYRDGHNANSLTTDFNGVANFNETFPLFNWYVVEADSTRYKTTGIHTVYDAGGPADGSSSCGPSNGARACGTSTSKVYDFLANTYEGVPLPADLSVPGAVYCASADCAAEGSLNVNGVLFGSASHQASSTGRIDPPWVLAEGWSGETSQGNWIEFGKAPYASCPPACATVPAAPGSTTATKVGENGGIQGFVAYVSTRPFDDASQMIQQPWEPNIPRVTVNLYQESFAADGATPTLTLVDTTRTSSWDDWAQGFYPNSTAGSGAQKPYMNCPGQGTATGTNADLFYFTLFDQPNYLDLYNSQHNGGTLHTLPYNSQFKCYDAMHIWNQLQPAPYDGKYSFPSSLGIDPTTGKPITPTGYINPITGLAPAITGTNCTICVPNPDSTDTYRYGTPMLPPGKYVAQVIMPPGYEVYKEEDKNLLIGDNFIAPVTQQFGGLGGFIFIIPDQASVASLYDQSAAGYNPNNFQDQTTALGLSQELSGVPGFPGFQDPLWPCVGEMRVVPDYLSLFPQAKEVAPFAGAIRPLCDRKEVTLANQMSVRAHFSLFTSTHIASKYTGVITDDLTSEFDPFSPQFGEKFAPPNLPISTRDYLGNEISRVYADHWGVYDGLTYSSWEVNPPNITGYSPTMMVQCMNDPGPIRDTNSSSPTFGQLINDPLYNAAYSDFCYEQPFMPGLTNYTDTPVVPTQAFAGAAYNNADCAYPDSTPAISEVDGEGIGPWVSAAGAGHTLTITALGNQLVNNYGYAGPSGNVAPFNAKTVTRHYGFGTRCTSPSASSATCNTLSSVTIGGVPATIGTWSETSITATVPTGVPNCTIQQQAQYVPAGTTTAQCGELVITAGNGRQSVDGVTVTIGGKAPIHVAANATIQSAIDGAAPGDLLMVDPTCTTGTGAASTTVACTTTGAAKASASHTEMLIMWKPVRLQGVGAATSIINANAQPAGKLLDPWRRRINCLFGLTIQGVPYGASAPYDPSGKFSCPDTGWINFTAQPDVPQIDRLPLEATVGWDASLNGNIAELLQEPTLLGAYEGAGITVLGKGLDFHGQAPWSDGTEPGAFPTVTTLLTGVVSDPGDIMGADAIPLGDANPLCHTLASTGTSSTSNAIISQTNPFPSNFVCNPSSIDGLTVTNSSQGGGGIFIHGWAHFLQVANNRIYNNVGTLSGGVSVGQGEFAGPYIQGGATNAAPGSCSDGTGFVTNQHLPYCLQLHVNLHNNSITQNSSLGDELFAATLAGGGGVTFCTGNDYYLFNYNWVCGNVTAGEGGGLAHLGEIFNGDIERNSVVFNQSTNPDIPSNGGGIVVQGTPDTDPVCGSIPDSDCPPGLSDGTGPGTVINANLIQGNSADSGSGGGIRLNQVNGTDISTFPLQPNLWHDVTITNNIIVNNMTGWDGGGISLQDALNVKIINNTIAHNDSLASSGVLTNSIGTPQASAPAGNCVMTGPTGTSQASCPQSAGVTSTLNSALLTTTFTGPAATLTCPTGQGGCKSFSNPLLVGNMLWQNRSFIIGVGGLGSGNLNQQNIISLFDAISSTPAPSQTATGQCSSGVTYWDLGVRGDTSPTSRGPFSLNPVYSIITSTTGYTSTGTNNSASNPAVVAQYCNGSRVAPECTVADGCGGTHGFGVPPGIADSLTPNPVFSLTPNATVDEGNNWINVSWGPLSLTNPSVTGGAYGNYGGGPALGNYSITSGSPAMNYIPCLNSNAIGQGCMINPVPGNTTYTITLPTIDFNGKRRPDPGTPGQPKRVDVGAVEVQLSATGATPPLLTGIAPSDGLAGSSVNVTISGFGLTGATLSTGANINITNVVVVDDNTVTATFVIAGGVSAGNKNITVTTPAGSGTVVFQVLRPTLSSITPTSGVRGTSVNVTLTGDGLTGATSVNAPGQQNITVTNFVAVNDTTVTATLNLAPATALGSGHTITVTNSGGANTNSLGFTVTGATVTISAPSPALTTGTANTTVKNGTITVSNAATATAPLTLTAAPTIVVTTLGTGSFSITGGTCVSGTVINPGGSCTIAVQYAPTGTTTSTAHVSLANSGAGTNPLSGPSFNAN